MPTINLHHTCCMEFMRGLPDKAYDLAIVDPPYGVGHFTQSDRVEKYGDYAWNESVPNRAYFDELIRVSKRRIIWGANYYNCFENEMGAIVWNKKNPHPSMSVCEIASVSWGKRVGYVEIAHYGFVGEHDNFHPCGKPVALYRWLLKNYAKSGDKILDTHGGSMSIAIACDIEGFDLTLCEIDADYFAAGKKRLEQHQSQPRLFDAPKVEPEQLTLLDELT